MWQKIPYYGPIQPLGHDFNKFAFLLLESFQVNLSFSGPVVLERRIL
jgi:hypothetical protein